VGALTYTVSLTFQKILVVPCSFKAKRHAEALQ